MKRLICGTIIKAHGLKGEVKVYPKTDFIEDRFQVKKKLFVNNKDEIIVKSVRKQKELLLVTFVGYDRIEDIEPLIKKDLYVDVEEDDHDGLFYFELKEMDVYDQNNKLIGKVQDVMTTAAHDVLIIDHNGKKLMIPYVDAFILDEDVDNKKIIVKLIPGMIDEN